MKIHPILFFACVSIAFDVASQPHRPNVIISEVKLSPDDRFIEIRSEESSVSLDGFQLVAMEYSKDRSKCNEGAQLRIRGALSLKGKRTVNHYAFIGKHSCLYLMDSV